MSNLKPSLRPQERQVDVIEINLRAKEKIVGDRSMPNLARARALPLAKRKFQRRAVRCGSLSGHNTVDPGDGSLIITCGVMAVMGPGCYAQRAITP